MACEIIGIEDDLVSARITGVLRLVDQQTLQNLAGQVIAKGRKVRFLAILERFEGWEKGVDWGDIGFFVEYADDIAKMAIVGDTRWKEEVFAFVGKGLRTTAVEYFPLELLEEAKTWVQS
ncbi:MAG: STAS/SEC14 domain-containing protein [Syntrophobacteraceae bacterium]